MSEINPLIAQRLALLSESEISTLLSDLRRTDQLLAEVKPSIEKALTISDLSHDGLTALTLDLVTSIVDMEEYLKTLQPDD
jgi:hypothetical protein